MSEDFVKPDPADKLVNAQCKSLTGLLLRLKSSRHISNQEKKDLLPPQPYSGTLPRFYGLPKIHKIGTLKIRPIISTTGNFAEKLLLKMKSILNTLLWGTTTLSNSYEFVDLVQEFQFGASDILLSFDVESLFTRVPLAETLEIVEHRLEEMRKLPDDPLLQITSMSNHAIITLLRYTLEDCFFTWDGILYQQVSGLPMAGRLSPILANICMEHLEYTVLTSALVIPRLYFRYVDDIFVVWDASKGSSAQFLGLLNEQHPNIVLVEERETDNTLPFLDVSVKKPKFDESGKIIDPLQIDLYRKTTNSDRYLQFASEHPPPMKRSLVRGLWLHAQRLLKKHPRQLSKELTHLKRTLSNENNGYPESVLQKWFKEFGKEIRKKPQLLVVKSQLKFAQMFDSNGQQLFVWPMATDRFPVNQDSMGEQRCVDQRICHAQTDHITNNLSRDPGDMNSITEALDAVCGFGDAVEMEEGAPVPLVAGDLDIEEPARINAHEPKVRRPMMVIPYLHGVSDRLQKIAQDYGCDTWYTYPGRASDRFSHFKGQIHASKSCDVVYCTQCSCGLEYVGESGRNLKVRLNEHLKNSSRTGLTTHMLNERHKAAMHNTVILARERNPLKRKLLESICIKRKCARLCNTGPSIDISAVWDVCAPMLSKQLNSV